MLDSKKYKYVKNILSLDIVNFLSTWSLKNFKINFDSHVPLSSALHSKDSEIYYHVLHYLKTIMEKETSLILKPIYSYTRVYVGGCELKKHIDRPHCEISASITLDYHYHDTNYQWPLCMENTPILIKKGDGVIYKANEIEHWRPIFAQPSSSWHHQLFIHYVDLNGKYSHIGEEVNEK